MEKEIRDIIIPIRVSLNEREEIYKRARLVNRPLSTFIRENSLGYEIREKPERKLIIELIKEMRNVSIVINNLGREAHNIGFIDENILVREKDHIKELIKRIKKELL